MPRRTLEEAMTGVLSSGRTNGRVHLHQPDTHRCLHPHDDVHPDDLLDPKADVPFLKCDRPVTPHFDENLGVWFRPRWCEKHLGYELAAEDREREKEFAERFDKSRSRAAGLSDADLELPMDWLSPKLKAVDKTPTVPWRYLHGPPGTGKTTQLVLATRHYSQLGKRCRFISELALVGEMAHDGGRKDPREFIGYDVLAIDEFGEVSAEYTAKLVYQVLDGRYQAKKPTFFSSNRRLKSIASTQWYGGRVFDRIAELCAARKRSDKGDGVVHLLHSYRAGRDVPDPEYLKPAAQEAMF